MDALVSSLGCAVLVAVTVTDLERRIVPNRIVLPALVVALVVQTARDPSVEWVVAAVAAGGFFLALALVYPAGLGMGDVKLAAFLGAWLGRDVAVALFVGTLLGALPAIAVLVTPRRGRAQGVAAVRAGSRRRRGRRALLRRRRARRLARLTIRSGGCRAREPRAGAAREAHSGDRRPEAATP